MNALSPITYQSNVLPRSATPYMRAVEAAMRLPEVLWRGAAKVGDIKIDMMDAALPFLIWEYGLDEIANWVPDTRRALAEGPDWQAIRGTPQSIAMALAWIDVIDTLIEEDVQGSWWDLFQIGLSEHVPSARRIEAIVALARLSKPAHTDVIRIYNDRWDVRPLVWDQESWDSHLFDDWSGRWLAADKPKISLGRVSGAVISVAVSVNVFGARFETYDPSGHAGFAAVTGATVIGARSQTIGADMRANPFRVGWLDLPWSNGSYESEGATILSARIASRAAALDAAAVTGTASQHTQVHQAWSNGPWTNGPYIN